MGKPTPTQGKSQQSISSFFTKKPPTNTSQSSQTLHTGPPPRPVKDTHDEEVESDDEPIRLAVNARAKRALTEDATNGNNGLVERPLKRKKAVEDDQSSDFFPSTTVHKIPTSKPKGSPRTDKYLYNSLIGPASASIGVTEEEDPKEAAATKARKEELHRRFVKKLGHPDSLAQIRRRHWQSNEDSGALEDGEGGDGEDGEEETPAPAKTKKKGAKTGKLTPMEIQFLDIKRKHMDTLLIVEVGYKFKFFGEDARSAAKELGIVCIPGKFRFDERKSMCSAD